MNGEYSTSARAGMRPLQAAGFAILVCAALAGHAQEEAPTLRERLDAGREQLAGHLFGINVGAFADAASSYDDGGQQTFGFGAFELDLDAAIGDDLQGALALVRDSTSTTMTVAFLDYHTFGGRIAPRGRLWVEKGFHVQVGRFDVPFGNDWQFFASKDSVSLSRPLTTDTVMDGGYNDEGLRVLGNNGSVNFNAWWLRGFNNGQQLGTRVGLTPFSDPFSLRTEEGMRAEFGLSYFRDTDVRRQLNERAWALDGETGAGDWTGRFEYMMRRKEAQVADVVTVLHAWHLTQEYALADWRWPTTLFARYEQSWQSPPATADGAEKDARLVTGFNCNVGGSDIVQWKTEAQHYFSATPDTLSAPGMTRRWQFSTQLVLVL
ncbi:MAG: hypothetical protein PHF20_09615 [Halothiobacillaceae bacterium]|nr:hypothetical protein [Halothiobacillaceae bacterium]